jgi:hypothetical protein
MISWMPVAGNVEMGIGNMGRGGVTEKRTTGITEGQGARLTQTSGAGVEPSDDVPFALFCLLVGCYYCFIVCLHHREGFKQFAFYAAPAGSLYSDQSVRGSRAGRLGGVDRLCWSKWISRICSAAHMLVSCMLVFVHTNLDCIFSPKKDHR